MEIILRKEAREKGLLTYFTGQACHKGHVAERRVASGSCNECRKGWTRDWRARGGVPSETFNLPGKELPSYEYLHECFTYNDGELYWKQRPFGHFNGAQGWKTFNKRYAGKLAGHAHKSNKYIEVRLADKLYKAHRIVYKMMTGLEPNLSIDHIDGNPSNNRFENLRPATQQENSRSMSAGTSRRGKSTYKGVSKRGKRWQCMICINDKSEIHIFDTEIEAALHYNYLAEKYFKDFAKLNVVCREPNEVYDIEETLKRLGVDYE